MMEVDCALGGGGGSIVRISAAIAAAKNIPMKLYNIRKKRPNPGLQVQHIEAIEALKQFSGIKVEGLYKGSMEITITPGTEKSNCASIKINTAGSISLVSQAVLYYAWLQQDTIKLEIMGGATHGKWAPSIEYVDHVTHKLLEKMNKRIKIDVTKFGFYPKGGASCTIYYQKSEKMTPIYFVEKSDLESVEIYSIASLHLKQRKVADRQVDGFLHNLSLKVEPSVSIKYVSTLSPGSGITVVNKYANGAVTGCFVVGEPKLSAETVGKTCKMQWIQINNSSAPIDEYAADQLIIPMALTEGKSQIKTYKLTEHTKTNILLTKKLLNREVEITKDSDGLYILSVK